jgi:ADP-ribosylglycohydrolase
MEKEINLEDKIKGGIIGLLVGDALGVPYEFHESQEIPFFDEIEFEPPQNFRRAHAGVPIGTWSDDGAQALCLLSSLLECGKFDADDFAAKLVAWYREDYMAVDEVFDIGIQTQRAILNLRKGDAPLEAGLKEERNNGNGSLMRVLPLALRHQGSDEELIADAFDQSAVTHGHLRSRICCALYCLWARRILQNIENPWENAVETFKKTFPDGSEEITEFETGIFPANAEYEIRGSGYVVDSLRAAVFLNDKYDDYEKIVKAAIALGEDTDTTACIAGGIAGLRFGIENIPERWRENLRGKEIYEPLLKKLISNISNEK